MSDSRSKEIAGNPTQGQKSPYFVPTGSERKPLEAREATLSGALKVADLNAQSGLKIPMLDTRGDIFSRITTLSKILITSTLKNLPPEKLANEIANTFNSGLSLDTYKPAIVATRLPTWSGVQLKEGEFLLAKRNEFPQLVAYTPYKLVKNVWFYESTKVEIIGTYTLEKQFFGYGGTYVLAVPEGKFGLITKDNKHFIYDEGYHIVTGNNIKFDLASGFINKNTQRFTHGNINVLQVGLGEMAKITMEGEVRLLDYTIEPYVFLSYDFKFHGFERDSETVIWHKNYIRILLRKDQVAIIEKLDGKEVITVPLKIITDTSTKVLGVFSTAAQQTYIPIPGNPSRLPSLSNFRSYLSKDGFDFAVRLLATYQVNDIDKMKDNIPPRLADQGSVKISNQQHANNDFVRELLQIHSHVAVTKCFREINLRATPGDNEPQYEGERITQLPSMVEPGSLETLETNIQQALTDALSEIGIHLLDLKFEIQPWTVKYSANFFQSLSSEDKSISQLIETSKDIIGFLNLKSAQTISLFAPKQMKMNMTPSSSYSTLSDAPSAIDNSQSAGLRENKPK